MKRGDRGQNVNMSILRILGPLFSSWSTSPISLPIFEIPMLGEYISWQDASDLLRKMKSDLVWPVACLHST